MATIKVQNRDGTWEEVKIKLKGESENLSDLTNRVEIVENLIKNGNGNGNGNGGVVTPVETHKHDNIDVLNKLSEQGELLLFNNKEIVSNSLTTRINGLESDISTINSELGLINSELESVGTEIVDLKQSVGNGKNLIATAITDKGVITSSDDDFSTMAKNILSIKIIDETVKTEDYSVLDFNFYIQEEEPVLKNGVWIEKDKKIVKKIKLEESLDKIYAPKNDIQDVDFSYEIPKNYPLYKDRKIKTNIYGTKIDIFLLNELTEDWEIFRTVDFYDTYATRPISDEKYINGKIYVFGYMEYSGGNKPRFLFMHDLDKNTTSVVHHFGSHNDGVELLWVGNTVYFLSKSFSTPLFAKYDTDKGEYKELRSKNIKSINGAFIHHNGYIYYIGGMETHSTNSSATYMSSRFQRYDIKTNTWTTLIDLPIKMFNFQAFALDGFIYTFFGNAYSSYGNTVEQWYSGNNNIFKYSFADDTWTIAKTFDGYYPQSHYTTIKYYNHYFYVKSTQHKKSSSYSNTTFKEDKHFKIHLGEELNIEFKGEQNCIHIEKDKSNSINLDCKLFDMKIGELNLELGRVVYSDNDINITDCIVYQGDGLEWRRIT